MVEIMDELLKTQNHLNTVEYEQYNVQLKTVNRLYIDEINPCRTAGAQAQQRNFDRMALNQLLTKTPR